MKTIILLSLFVLCYATIIEVKNEGPDIDQTSISKLLVEDEPQETIQLNRINEIIEQEIVEEPVEITQGITPGKQNQINNKLQGYKAIIKLEQLPQLKTECDDFLSKNYKEFENNGIIDEPLNEFFKDLKKFLIKAKDNAKKAISFKPGNSSKFNGFFKSQGVYSFQTEASKCFHRLNYADKWIEKRIKFVYNPRLNDKLIKIRQDLTTALSGIGVNTETIIFETQRIDELRSGELRLNNEDPETKPLISAIFDNSYLNYIRASIDTIDQLLPKKTNPVLKCLRFGSC